LKIQRKYEGIVSEKLINQSNGWGEMPKRQAVTIGLALQHKILGIFKPFGDDLPLALVVVLKQSWSKEFGKWIQ
jgi:hypothetical protein